MRRSSFVSHLAGEMSFSVRWPIKRALRTAASKRYCASCGVKSLSRFSVSVPERSSMPRDPKYIADFKAFARRAPDASHLPVLQSELYGTNDRASAVMLSSVVERSLEGFLRSHLRPSWSSDDERLLFDFNGPFDTFAAKTLASWAFNLFGPET